MKGKDKSLQEINENGKSLNTCSIKALKSSNDLDLDDLFKDQLAMVVRGVDLNRPLGVLSVEGLILNKLFGPRSESDECSDPYCLAESSPLVSAIYFEAFRQHGKPKREIDKNAIIAELKKCNVNVKHPKPFTDGRLLLASNLANPHYKYDRKSEHCRLEITRTVPDEPFFKQSFVNEQLAKVLYGACCWGGYFELDVAGDKDALVELLVGLGFKDADEEDLVYGLLIFITGEKYTRGGVGQPPYTHERTERTHKKKSRR